MDTLQVTEKTQVAITPDQMIMKGIESGLDIDKLEKLMSLQERWEAKNAERAFFDAMNSFQARKPPIVKNKKVAYKEVKYNYATLASIQKAIDPILGGFGLSYTWEQEGIDGKIKITCIVSHVDGHSRRTFLEAPADNSGSKNSIQSIGSTISYLKRYTLTNAFGLSSDDDDDGISGRLPILLYESEQWFEAIKYLKGGGVIGAIEKKYNLNGNKEKLMDASL